MKAYLILPLVLIFTSCVEVYDFAKDIEGNEGTLVVEATLTNEMKSQVVLLGRSAGFEPVNQPDSIYDPSSPGRPREPVFDAERNATVTVLSEAGSEFLFNEIGPGKYASATEFAAEPDMGYSLIIRTADGQSYRSNTEQFNGLAQIEEIYASRDFNDIGNEGVFIYVDGTGNPGNSGYYRYEYEETYRIEAPNWKPFDFMLTNYDPCALPEITYDLEIINRDNEEGKVCYGSAVSDQILQKSTLGLLEDRFLKFPVRFIDRTNFIISHRYSILVKQYTQSAEAYSYYERLNSFARNDDIFSQIQPGFLNGNILSETDSEEPVLGYFEVASVTQKRLFINYGDLFPGEALPDYPIGCTPFSVKEDHPSYCIKDFLVADPCPQSLVERINLGMVAYVDKNEIGLGSCPGPYIIVPRACGDCTELGASAVPDFWID